MQAEPVIEKRRRPFARFGPWFGLMLILLLVALVRIRLLEMPLERDEGEYAYAGQLILQGIPPYELAYNMKLPGTYFAYAVGMALFGQTTAGVHLTLLAINALTIGFMFLLGRKISGTTGGLAAAVSYALLSTSTAVLGMAAHATQFVVLFAVPATLLLWSALETRCRRTIFFCGLFYGLAFLMKQQGICFGVFGFLVLLGREKIDSGSKLDSARRLGVYLAGAFLPFALVCVYLSGAGVFPQFWFWTFSYARAYAAGTPLSEGVGYLLDYLREQKGIFVCFVILACAGLLVALRRGTEQKRISFALLFLFFSFLGTVPGLYFRQHYFVLLLPALALLVGMAVVYLESFSHKLVPVVLLSVVLAWGVHLERWVFWKLPPLPIAQGLYGDNPQEESAIVAKYIREHSAKDARVAVVGSEPQIYFYADRHSATGYIYTYPLMENQPYAVTMQQSMIAEIEAAKPEFLIIVVNRYSWLVNQSSHLEILHWAREYTATNYDRVGIVDCRANQPRVELWDDAVKNYPSAPDQFLDVYRRKVKSD